MLEVTVHNSIFIFLSISTGYLTYIFHDKTPLSASKASALSTLIICGVIFFTNQYITSIDEHLNQYYAISFGGSFVGMSTRKVLSPLALFIACGLFGAIYLQFSAYYFGIGGALGTSACLSVIVVYLIQSFIFKLKARLNG